MNKIRIFYKLAILLFFVLSCSKKEVKEVKVDDWKHGDKVPEGYRALFTADGYILEKL